MQRKESSCVQYTDYYEEYGTLNRSGHPIITRQRYKTNSETLTTGNPEFYESFPGWPIDETPIGERKTSRNQPAFVWTTTTDYLNEADASLTA